MEDKIICHSLEEQFFADNPALVGQKENIMSACRILIDGYQEDHMLLVAGNGGSAADSDHIVGELMKGFKSPRTLPDDVKTTVLTPLGDDGKVIGNGLQRALRAISLSSNHVLLTAFANDVDPALSFAQQVYGYGRAGDMFLGLSTSGNSRNVVLAMKLAKALGLRTIALSGGHGGELAHIAEVTILSPADETYRIQEFHLPIYHFICAYIEAYFFGQEES